MTSSKLQKQVKTVLESTGVPVTKDWSEYDEIFPHIVYREISNVPALHGDNREQFFRAVYQIAIVTDDDEYETLESAVETAMIDLGFMRTDAQDIFDVQFQRVLRFSISVQKTFYGE